MITFDEHRINDLVGPPTLLNHEIRLWEQRSRWLNRLRRWRWRVASVGAILVLGGALGLALWRLLQAPDLDFSMETKLAYVVAGAIVFVLVVANMVRIIRLGGLKDLAQERSGGSQGGEPMARHST